MIIVTNLPKAFVVQVFSEWIDMKCVGQIDTAFCSEKMRPMFLNLIQHAGFVVDDLPTHKDTNMVAWLEVRKVNRFRSLSIDCGDLQDGMLLSLLNQIDVSKVESFSLLNCHDNQLSFEQLGNVLRECHKVTKLKLSNVHCLTNITPASCETLFRSELTSLALTSTILNVIPIDAVSHIVEHCGSLVDFEFCLSDVEETSIILELGGVEAYESLILQQQAAIDDTLNTLTNYCPELVRLKLKCFGSPRYVANFICSARSLEVLEIDFAFQGSIWSLWYNYHNAFATDTVKAITLQHCGEAKSTSIFENISDFKAITFIKCGAWQKVADAIVLNSPNLRELSVDLDMDCIFTSWFQNTVVGSRLIAQKSQELVVLDILLNEHLISEYLEKRHFRVLQLSIVFFACKKKLSVLRLNGATSWLSGNHVINIITKWHPQLTYFGCKLANADDRAMVAEVVRKNKMTMTVVTE